LDGASGDIGAGGLVAEGSVAAACRELRPGGGFLPAWWLRLFDGMSRAV